MLLIVGNMCFAYRRAHVLCSSLETYFSSRRQRVFFIVGTRSLLSSGTCALFIVGNVFVCRRGRVFFHRREQVFSIVGNLLTSAMPKDDIQTFKGYLFLNETIKTPSINHWSDCKEIG